MIEIAGFSIKKALIGVDHSVERIVTYSSVFVL